MTSVDDILEKCLQQVLSGQSTVDDCLAQNPQHADLLRSLLQTALQIDQLDRPEASSSGFQAGRKLMMDALTRKEEKRALSPLPKQGFWRRWSAFPHARSRGAVAMTRLAAVSVLGAATLLVWVAAGALVVRMWNGTLLPQRCIVAEASGITQVRSGRDADWQTLISGRELAPGDRIRTGDPANATIRFSGGGSTSVGPNSQLEIVELAVRRDGRGHVIILRQAAGSTHNLVEGLADSTTLFEIHTAGASVVAHGTEFLVLVNPDSSTSVVVVEGVVSVTGRGATVTLAGGQAIVVDVGEDPGPVVPASPEDLVESPSPESSPSVYREATATLETPTGAAIPGPAGPALEPQLPTATYTSRLASPTAVPAAPTPTTTPRPLRPTATLKPPTPTMTPRPPSATATPEPPTPTATAQPPSPTPTSAPSPTLKPVDTVEVFYAVYREEQEDLRVKARTNIVGCTLTLEGFGAMEAEGDHWLYVQESLDGDDVPSTVTVRSSCGGSGSSPVSWS